MDFIAKKLDFKWTNGITIGCALFKVSFKSFFNRRNVILDFYESMRENLSEKKVCMEGILLSC